MRVASRLSTRSLESANAGVAVTRTNASARPRCMMSQRNTADLAVACYTAAMPEYATILVDASGPVGRITLNRPDKRNPIGPATCGELVAALGVLKLDTAVRVV